MKRLNFDERLFYITGEISQIKLLMSEEECLNILPAPQDISVFNKELISIWRYGNRLELHFTGDDKKSRKLSMIYSDTFEEFVSADNFEFIPWLINNCSDQKHSTNISLPYVLQKLKSENIETVVRYSKTLDMVEIRLSKSKVVLSFENIDQDCVDKVDCDLEHIDKNKAYCFTVFSLTVIDQSELNDYKIVDIIY